MGLGAWICETDSGRPLGMSTDRDARLRDDRWCRSPDDDDEWWRDECEDEDELLLDDDLCDEDDEDLDLCEDEDDEEVLDEERCLSAGTSRMFSSRPVVGSVVDVTLGLCATWYPSMM